MKKFIAIILSATTIFTCNMSVFADDTKTIEIAQSMEIKNAKKNTITSPQDASTDNSQKLFINDKQIEIKDGSIVYQDRLFLPVRELGEALGLEVEYVEKEKIVVLDNGKIQLPVNQNKAVVNGSILAIDKENDKVGTIVINNRTYLPLRFVSESLGYEVEYVSDSKEVYIKTDTININNETQTTTTTVLDKSQALEEYKKLYETNQNIKNSTVDTNANISFNMSDGTDSINMKMNLVGTTKVDISDKVSMYFEQKNTMELLGQQEVIEQKGFYKDGELYVNQSGLKYKMPLDLEEAMKLSNGLNVNNFISEELILSGSVKNLDNGNKEYSFDIDFNKSIDMASQIIESLYLGEQDLQVLNNLKITNTKTTMVVDNKNKPISYSINFDMDLTAEGINIKGNVSIDTKYKDIDKTFVSIPSEDLSSYGKFEDLITTDIAIEETTETTTQ